MSIVNTLSLVQCINRTSDARRDYLDKSWISEIAKKLFLAECRRLSVAWDRETPRYMLFKQRRTEKWEAVFGFYVYGNIKVKFFNWEEK